MRSLDVAFVCSLSINSAAFELTPVSFLAIFTFMLIVYVLIEWAKGRQSDRRRMG